MPRKSPIHVSRNFHMSPHFLSFSDDAPKSCGYQESPSKTRPHIVSNCLNLPLEGYLHARMHTCIRVSTRTHFFSFSGTIGYLQPLKPLFVLLREWKERPAYSKKSHQNILFLRRILYNDFAWMPHQKNPRCMQSIYHMERFGDVSCCIRQSSEIQIH